MAMPMQSARKWTLEEMHRLPDDGNRYELVHGELFATPAPKNPHQRIVEALTRLLYAYVCRERLGVLQFPRSVIRIAGSETEPDLMVRADPGMPVDWEDQPVPVLVVEVLSATTRRRDLVAKREFYLEIGVAEYWIVDGKARAIHQVRPDHDDVVATESLTWHPAGGSQPLHADVPKLFHEAFGPLST
jgi:Uma2 family endonuclease